MAIINISDDTINKQITPLRNVYGIFVKISC